MNSKTEIQKLADQLFPVSEESDEPEVKNIPLEQRKLHTETADYTVATLFSLLANAKIKIPDFQRGYVWNRSQASRLIESLIIQCPIPVIYLSQERNGDLIVIDGQQRLSSIKLFLNDGFSLQGLTTYPELNGYSWSQLDPRFIDHINNRTIRCITILRDTHPQIRYDVFERLNTGSVKLNPQELRNGINYGPLMKAVNRICSDKEWRAASGTSRDSRMRNAELILRFFALKYNRSNYQKPLSSFLDAFSQDNRNIDSRMISEWENDFYKTFSACKYYFDKDMFKMYNPATKQYVSFNSAILDVQMVGFSESQNETLLEKSVPKEHVRRAFESLFGDEKFVASVQRATSDEAAVTRRISSGILTFSIIK